MTTETIEVPKVFLEAAKCPDPNCCDGVTVVEYEGCTSGCCGQPLENGECCGNAVAVQTQEQEPAPCWWCETKYQMLSNGRELDNLEGLDDLPF